MEEKSEIEIHLPHILKTIGGLLKTFEQKYDLDPELAKNVWIKLLFPDKKKWAPTSTCLKKIIWKCTSIILGILKESEWHS